ncbi:homocysteine S-methyltransferase [Streptomyces sp. ICBB 8177]|uniref:homocysteine S-methyltransferase n=1 Tax=Streptomyces sp. ICBB 8177 TaxID=563922 RepID=UPI000D675F23|nr:homocysteine S-methyltransferase [Streptomyces sp. ICBB 8177]PWI41324.1 homocysteine S-methyltransferase [Streptomyces sp. ICBB 8177]
MSAPATGLAAALARGPVVLDGGLSNQLADAGHDLSDALWSARLLADDPAAIEAAHAAYVAAGARVLITASYQATYEGFARRGVDRAGASRLLRRSVELAREAAGGRDEVWVAASVGPYGAMLADGSEYRGRYGVGVAELARFHRPRIETLAEAAPDVLALETVPDADEAEALLRAVEGVGVPVWLSYSVAGERTRAGQPLEHAFALAADAPEVIAVGVNCSTAADAERAIPIAREVTGKPVVVYPNSGERWDAGARAWRGEATYHPARTVARWHAAGARLIGGCCRVGPAAIREIAAALGPLARPARDDRPGSGHAP